MLQTLHLLPMLYITSMVHTLVMLHLLPLLYTPHMLSVPAARFSLPGRRVVSCMQAVWCTRAWVSRCLGVPRSLGV